ncbi:MAG TPA: nucleoside triphosphate pyrophosphatase [Isosphaeraceae bacterium]
MDLILASTSPYRRKLLEQLGLPFRCVAPGVDEAEVQSQVAEPPALAERLARAKAEAVFARHPDAVVIGSDQLVAFQGRALGKPGTEDRAVEQLLAMAGREHQLITAVALADRDGVEVATNIARLWLRPLGAEEAQRYVEADRPLDCAGSYKIESLGITLFDRIEASDQTAIVGLPLLTVCRMLRARGFELP